MRRNAIWYWGGVVVMGGLVAGCGGPGAPSRVANQMSFANKMFAFTPPSKTVSGDPQTRAVHGEARVLELEPRLGTVRLETESGERLGWWENRLTFAHSDGTATYENVFPARVGDRIRFHALEMNGDLYITAAQVIAR